MKIKHIKLFNEVWGYGKDDEGNTHNLKDIYPKRSFSEITSPKKPYKRELTSEETEFMVRNFKTYSWSDIDAEGRIILSVGSSNKGKYYITEEDLAKFMEE